MRGRVARSDEVIAFALMTVPVMTGVIIPAIGWQASRGYTHGYRN